MTRLLRGASAAALLVTSALVVGTTVPGFAQQASPAPVAAPAPSIEVAAPAEPATTAAPAVEITPTEAAPVAAPTAPAPEAVAVPGNAASLRAMVSAVRHAEPDNETLRCLAAGVYFESNGESLEGQLAVAHVILNRARSGRFASTVCGVLTQRGQFSFVRGGNVPTAPRNAAWRTAVAIARIAQAESWRNPAPGALFFHASRISPGWNRPRVARIDNHVFYR